MHNQSEKAYSSKKNLQFLAKTPPFARLESNISPDASLSLTNTALLAEDQQFLQ